LSANALERADEIEPEEPDDVSESALALDTTPGHLIRRAQQRHTALWSGELQGDLTGPQYALISALHQAGSADQQSAGRRASLDKSTTADVVARLERNGWIRRDRDPSDGRRNTITLTRVARAALGEITSRVTVVQQKLLSPLEPDQREGFSALLARVAYRGEPVVETEHPDPSTVLGLGTTPGHLIRRAEQVHATIWSEHVGDRVTPSQYALLCALALDPGIDQAAAGDLASLDKSSTADVVARLVRRGLVESTRDAADRRRKLLTVSRSAAQLLSEVTPHVRDVQEELLDVVSAEERVQLTDMLHAVAYSST
jgi:MarR family transcriptional regulator, lower aerobic nicotinate degradation pathway regulator